jgi:hypothetical protein
MARDGFTLLGSTVRGAHLPIAGTQFVQRVDKSALGADVQRQSDLTRKEVTVRTITPPEHREGIVARTIEQQTAKLPSDTFLWLAGASIAGSVTLKMMGRSHDALFVGQWAPTFLLLGIYNKIVKVAGSD